MSEVRKIKKLLRSKATVEGAGVNLKRAFGYKNLPKFDPFLLLDELHSSDPSQFIKGFPWHPHRGIETITYVLEGRLEHGDSMGNRGVIGPGDVQWMTAGSGIVHQEMPQGEDGKLWGFQLWTNLPSAKKMMAPRYREVRGADIPEVVEGGARVRIIAGIVQGSVGPVRDVVTKPELLDVSLPPGTEFRHGVLSGRTAFTYAIDGQARLGPDQGMMVRSETVALFGDGDEVRAVTEENPVRFLLASGDPIGEPVAWRGSIVMNTEEELKTAFDELERGTFTEHGARS